LETISRLDLTQYLNAAIIAANLKLDSPVPKTQLVESLNQEPGCTSLVAGPPLIALAGCTAEQIIQMGRWTSA
jgi:hypothetical protein